MTVGEVVTVIEGCADSPKWVPATSCRRTASEPPLEERLREAELRRHDLQSLSLARIAAHHKKISAARAAAKKRSAALQRNAARHRRAEERRAGMQQDKVRRVAEHHQRVDGVAEAAKRRLSGAALVARHREAEKRREQRLALQRQHLEEHAARVAKAQSLRQRRAARQHSRSQRVVRCFKLDSEAISDASFDEVQRHLASRETLSHAKDLLLLVSKSFEKVVAEEKRKTSESTPVAPAAAAAAAAATPPRSPGTASGGSLPPSPAVSAALLGSPAVGQVPLNPRVFLAAFVCCGGMMEGAAPEQDEDVKLLEETVRSHATKLLESLKGLLQVLERDATVSDDETRNLVKIFAIEWAAYVQSFEAWRRKDKTALLEHYIKVYSEVERGRVDILKETALKGSRKPELHAELMSSIDESLADLRQQIQRLSGDEGIDVLGRRLQEMYAGNGITPELAASATPSHRAADTSDANTPMTSDFELSPAAATAAAAAAAAEQQQQQQPSSPGSAQRERLQNRALKAKLAHDAVFKGLLEGGAAGAVGDASGESTAANTEDDEAAAADGQPLSVRRFKQAAERAFWDITSGELKADPSDVARIAGALAALKDLLLEVTPRRLEARVRGELADSLDWETLKVGFGANTLRGLLGFFGEKLLELEAPAENQATREKLAAELEFVNAHPDPGQLHLTVPRVFRFLHGRLEALSRSIFEARKSLIAPLLAQDAEQLVRELYADQAASGVHSFAETRRWLRDAVRRIVPGADAAAAAKGSFKAAPVSVDDVVSKTNALFTVLPALAVVDAVLYPQETIASALPETLVLHKDLLRRLADRVQLITLATAMGGLAGQVSGKKQVAQAAAAEVAEMLATPGLRLDAVAEHVAHIADREGGELLPTAKRDLLLSMLRKVANPQERVYATYLSRLGVLLVKAVVESPRAMAAQLAETPFAHLQSQVMEVATALVKTAATNVQWCRTFYDPILTDIADELGEARKKALEDEEL